MAQRRPNRPTPPRPGNGEEAFGIDLADPLYVEASTFFTLLDGQYLRLEIRMLEESEIASRSQRGSMN